MYRTEYFGLFYYEFWEFLLAPIYILFFYILASLRERRNKDNPVYKYYTLGLFAKITSAIIFCMIYIYYYRGGDSTGYWESGCAFVNLFFKSPSYFISAYFGSNTEDKIFMFDQRTGYPLQYIYIDPQLIFFIKLLVPVVFVSFKSYLLTGITLAAISYFGIWRLYLMFTEEYKSIYNWLAIAILFAPSALYWGSGVLKDTVTLMASCYLITSIYFGLIKQRQKLKNYIIILISAYVVVSIKAYIFIAILPGTLLWLSYNKVRTMQNKFLVNLIFPIVFSALIVGAYYFLQTLGSSLSKYRVDIILQTASSTQKDLSGDYYGENSFNLGNFDPTVGGILSKTPAAIQAGLFRPFLWESNNIVMLLSGVENFCILALTIWILIKIRINKIFKIIKENPMLFFSLSYAIIFSFAIGLTTPNFGALVRFKIPAEPFYLSFLFVMLSFTKKKNKI